ncbi:MAG: hypothetical protein IJU50_04050 [Lachnospiraceae bacterium]|nr:hypothetical protein [Lachnospiraceae bacterium]
MIQQNPEKPIPAILQDPSLPEGIFRDEQGAYHWKYNLDMRKNPAPLFAILKILWGVSLGVTLFAAILSVTAGANGILFGIKLFFFMGFGLGAFFSLIAWVVWMVYSADYGHKYVWEYLMTEERIIVLQTPEEQEHSRAAAGIMFLLFMLDGDPSTAAAGAGALASQRVDSVWKDVRHIIADQRHDLIKVNNLLLHNAIYANPQQYDFVWRYITAHCPKAKVKG